MTMTNPETPAPMTDEELSLPKVTLGACPPGSGLVQPKRRPFPWTKAAAYLASIMSAAYLSWLGTVLTVARHYIH